MAYLLPRIIGPVVLAALLTSPAAVAAETAGLEALRAAAVSGDADAQYELGILYEFGYHLADHKVLAYAWYARAAAQGHASAARRLDLLQPALSQPEIERARALARSLPAAASGG
ncbi:MAG TPA: hypothetical protein VF203_03730 [Burkholderiales bacterium]